MSRDAWGDTVKGGLIVLVVFWHVVMKSTLQVDWHLGVPVPGAWGLIADVVWPFLMPLFLLVSGVYAADALRRPWAAVLRPRVVRFLYLYLLWSFLHTATMWAFPDFPTLVPRGVAAFVEAVTVSPPDTWYLYALALYFLAAKSLLRLPPWLVVAAAAALTVVVAAGYVDVVSNRGSLLSNLTFFLLGAHFAPRIRRAVERVGLRVALGAGALYLAAFSVMRVTQTQETPGVWPLVSLLGVVMGLAAAPCLARTRFVGAGLRRLGQRTLPIYLIHMPLLAVVDALLNGWLSTARTAVQLVAATTFPVVLTAALIAACLALARLVERDGSTWLFDLPGRTPAASGTAVREPGDRASAKDSSRTFGARVRIPWRIALAVALIATTSVGASRATAIAGCPTEMPHQDAEAPGRVSIGAVGDVLMHDVGHRVPADGGAGHFAAVGSWFTQDLVTGNLEQVISEDTGHDKCDGREDCLAFRSDPGTARYLTGFDLMNLANNHTSDHGPEGYRNTERALEANGVRSIGRRDQVVCTDVGGTTVATIGFAPYSGTNRVTDLRHVAKLVAAAEATADVVIVHAHMGAEGPEANVVGAGPEQMYGEDRGDVRAFAHTAVDAGADLVVGHGPHSLRGTEFRKGRLIAYSLGNFGGGGVFGADEATRYGAYLEVTLARNGSFLDGHLRSVHFEHADGRPVPDPIGRAAALIDRFGQRDLAHNAADISASGVLRPVSQRD